MSHLSLRLLLILNYVLLSPYFFDSVKDPRLQSIALVLREEKGRVSLAQQLNQLSSLLSHDSKNVRYSALKELLR
jgi:hypothetical protein